MPRCIGCRDAGGSLAELENQSPAQRLSALGRAFGLSGQRPVAVSQVATHALSNRRPRPCREIGCRRFNPFNPHKPYRRESFKSGIAATTETARAKMFHKWRLRREAISLSSRGRGKDAPRLLSAVSQRTFQRSCLETEKSCSQERNSAFPADFRLARVRES